MERPETIGWPGEPLTLSLSEHFSGYTLLLLEEVDKTVHRKQVFLPISVQLGNITANPTFLLLPFLTFKKSTKRNILLTSTKHLK